MAVTQKSLLATTPRDLFIGGAWRESSSGDRFEVHDPATGSVLTSVLALVALSLPFVVFGPVPGLEIVHPLAVVLLGGLVTTFVVIVFLLPAVYHHVAARPGRRQRREPEDELDADVGGPELAPAAAGRGEER